MVIQFTSKLPRGMCDVSLPRNGMVLLDGCLPATMLPAFFDLMNTAGITVGRFDIDEEALNDEA